MARPKIYASDAQRVAAYRARRKLVPVTIDLPADVVEGLEEYLRFKDTTKSNVIAKLISTQLLRKR